MSVLKSKRKESKAEFVNVADQIFSEVLAFMARLSNRYQRLLAQDTMRLASNVLDHAEMAQNIYIHDEQTYTLRRAHLLECRASLMALDVHMTHIWQAMMKNPQGCFTNTKGQTKSPSEATEILDKMAISLGEKIDKEKGMLTKLMQSDKERVHL